MSKAKDKTIESLKNRLATAKENLNDCRKNGRKLMKEVKDFKKQDQSTAISILEARINSRDIALNNLTEQRREDVATINTLKDLREKDIKQATQAFNDVAQAKRELATVYTDRGKLLAGIHSFKVMSTVDRVLAAWNIKKFNELF